MTIASRLQAIHQQIQLAERRYQRPPGSVKLLLASKQQGINNLTAALAAGQHCFGENYLQEALLKIAALKNQPITWHFIGSIQANKTQLIAEHFSWVHSIDRLKIAQRLNAQRPSHLPPLNICIEVNISQQASKSGIAMAELSDLAYAVAELKNINLRGLMAIPQASNDFAQQLNLYQQVQQAQLNLGAQGLVLDTLSMGMSNDFNAAIAAGSTLIRIGTAIFGPR